MERKHKSVDRFSIKTIEISGFAGALEALRLPYGGECKSILQVQPFTIESSLSDQYDDVTAASILNIHKSDIKLMETLVERGDEHAKILRGVVVWCKIDAPRYWWVECDTYRIGCERLSSESTMHIQGKGMPTDTLVELKESLKEDTIQRRVWMFNYQTLRRIFIQRKNHRLPQWRVFCQWIKQLPYADRLILAGLEDTEVTLL